MCVSLYLAATDCLQLARRMKDALHLDCCNSSVSQAGRGSQRSMCPVVGACVVLLLKDAG